MVVHIAEEQTACGLVDDQTQISCHPHGPEIPVPSLVQLVKAHARVDGVHLQVKGRGLDSLLLLTRKSGKAIGKCFGDKEVHRVDRLIINV